MYMVVPGGIWFPVRMSYKPAASSDLIVDIAVVIGVGSGGAWLETTGVCTGSSAPFELGLDEARDVGACTATSRVPLQRRNMSRCNRCLLLDPSSMLHALVAGRGYASAVFLQCTKRMVGYVQVLVANPCPGVSTPISTLARRRSGTQRKQLHASQEDVITVK